MLAPTELSSQAEVWYLKEICFQYKFRKVITQNFNGPCSFIAICNVLILRDKIQILPAERTTVSYEFLSQLVCDYLLNSRADKDISAALAALPCTQTGMDLNPLFTGPTAFRPGGDGAELELFKLVDVDLVHGWLVDPQSPEYHVISKVEDYDTAAMLLAEVDHLTNGQLLSDGAVAGSSSSSGVGGSHLNDKQRKKVEDAFVVRQFLDTTWTQLTYHGLFALNSVIKPGTLVALFRSSHLSVLYKHLDHTIYSLVTDHSFLHEPSVVWERLDDITYSEPSYVDADFEHSVMLGGDVAGQTVEAMLYTDVPVDPLDEALAIQLQEEEDRLASRALERQSRPQQMLVPLRRDSRDSRDQQKKGLKKKKSDCIVM